MTASQVDGLLTVSGLEHRAEAQLVLLEHTHYAGPDHRHVIDNQYARHIGLLGTGIDWLEHDVHDGKIHAMVVARHLQRRHRIFKDAIEIGIEIELVADQV